MAGRRSNGQLDACAWEPGPTSTTEELCGCLGRGSTGPSSRRAGRGPGHKTLGAAPAGEPGASHKGRLGGRLRLALKAGICGGIFVWRVSGARSCSERCLSSRVVATLLANSSAAPARAYPPPAPLTDRRGSFQLGLGSAAFSPFYCDNKKPGRGTAGFLEDWLCGTSA